MSYTPPAPNAVDFAGTGIDYTPPASSAVNFFWPRYVYPESIDGAVISTDSEIDHGGPPAPADYLYPVGFDAAAIGADSWIDHFIRQLYPVGWDFLQISDEYSPLDPDTGLPVPRIDRADEYLEAMGLDSLVIPQASILLAPPGSSSEWQLRTSFGYMTLHPEGLDSAEIGGGSIE